MRRSIRQIKHINPHLTAAEPKLRFKVVTHVDIDFISFDRSADIFGIYNSISYESPIT